MDQILESVLIGVIFQGISNWEDAKEKCGNIGIRLPKLDELKSAYAAGVTELWEKDGFYYYWSADSGESIETFPYKLQCKFWSCPKLPKDFDKRVRCIR